MEYKGLDYDYYGKFAAHRAKVIIVLLTKQSKISHKMFAALRAKVKITSLGAHNILSL